ncbi:hypothetical protein KKC44_05105 [Patescibacteria group bacterium]|nr:hypothetical protein [Patescibacteria group bacterium]MBU2259953.1 hypothetical protein [Patescibacteria group bacterium]
MMNWIRQRPNYLVVFLQQQRIFIPFVLFLCLIVYVIQPYPSIAMWLGFGIAGYSAIANDSIQTLGTFLSSNRDMRWWVLWIFIGGVLVITYAVGWALGAGDIAFERLSKIPQPQSFTFFTLSAPIVLIILTRLRMPVSTTFLLLSTFSGSVLIKSMLVKTFLGYIVAFVVAILIWGAIAIYSKRSNVERKYNRKRWRVLQACSTGFLWWTWLMHDTANVAVFLPRTLSFNQMAFAVGLLFLIVGLVMYWRGGNIQTIVTEKTDIVDLRSATIIDFVLALVLLFFKEINTIPMSTTFVFLGLLAGREIALTVLSRKAEPYKTTAKLVFKDITRAGMGLLISLIMVLFVCKM